MSCRVLIVSLLALVLLSCSDETLRPVRIDLRNDMCASCRMAVSNAKLAAELLSPGEEPRIFDDIGCLAAYLRDHKPAAGAAVYVADHRTGEWVPARAAMFTRVDSIETPMESHLVAHADEASRRADGVTGAVVEAAQLFGESR